MTTETGAPAGQSAAPAMDSDELSLEDARALIDSGNFSQNVEGEEQEQEPGADDATKRKKSASQEEDADPETDPSEEEPKADDQEDEELPPIERPRSWAKELDEEWNSYPRAAQERIAKREQERDTAIRRSQNEAAEERKAAKAAQDMAEKARQQYEGQLPALMQALHDANAAQFSDIKSIEDVTKLAQEDPFRYLQWQAHQQKMAVVKAEADSAAQRNAQAAQSAWNDHVNAENAAFEESVPEGERSSLKKMRDDAPQFLTDKGFKQGELQDLATGKSKLSIYDHRIQGLIRDSMRLAEIQAAPAKVAAKPVPQVQKPGIQGGRTSADASIQALENRLNKTGSMEDAWALMEAQMKQSSRRSA